EDVGVDATIVLEPERRDSAAAIAAAAVVAGEKNSRAVLLTLAADHVIFDPDLFQASCRAGSEAGRAGYIVMFGLEPSEPRTSYGYIDIGSPLEFDGVHEVASFVEKPDAATAARYVASGYLWNSGNFLFRVDEFLSELDRHEPEIGRAVESAVRQATPDLGFLRLDATSFAKAPRKSVDYAVLEKTSRAAVVEGRFRWSDIGSWDAVYDVSNRDRDGNVLVGPAVARDTQHCLIHAEGRITAALGVEDLAVISTSDAVLVLPRARSEEVKDLVSELKEMGRSEISSHRRVYRPWGHYEGVDAGERFQVKRIVVEPGCRLSLQRHMHRAEHWVVVRGTAIVRIGEQERIVHENESTYIPIGALHRLENRGKIPLEIIEVQTGSYLGEDDIIRVEDVYGRGVTGT